VKQLILVASIVAAAGSLVASEGDELTSLSYISYLERYATIQPATEADSVEALINMPLIPGDRIDTAREARMEITLADGNVVWLDEYSTVSLDAVAFSRDDQSDRTVLFLREGTVMVEISAHRLSGEPVRIDGPDGTVYLADQGLYRVQVLPSGGLRVEVWEGLAEAATIEGGIQVAARSSAELSGGAISGTESHLTQDDEFAAWVGQRRRITHGESGQHVEARYERQAAQLDNYGNWVYVAEYNTWAWQPNVSSNWRPYSAGRWYWTPAGWSWVSYEPWGWLPYHYGRWYFSVGFGWVWGSGGYWGPAWVNWCWWPGYVGWCPSGYYWGWYWPRYCHYYGYPSWPAQPVHPVPHRGSIPRPGTPVRRAEDTARRASLPRPEDSAINLKGRVRVADMDRRGWSVVSDRDFASPHLSRMLKSGDEAFRGRDDVGVVMSESLRTAPPNRARPSDEIERVLRQAGRSVQRDLTPVLARDDTLRPEDALRLVETTTHAALTRRAAPSEDSGTTTRGTAGGGTGGGTNRSIEDPGVGTSTGSSQMRRSPALTTREGSPLHRNGASSRTGGSSSGRPVVITGRGNDTPNPFVPRTRPSVTEVTSRTRPTRVGSDASGGSTPSTRSGTATRSPVTPNSPSTRSGSGVTRPVVVPRSAPSTSRRPSASSSQPSRRNPTASPGRTRSPSSRSSVSRAPSSSARSGATRSRPSSSGRSSSGRSSAPRSSSSGSSRK
jgi:hypothetical protein